MKWKDSFEENQIEESNKKGKGSRASKSIMPTLLVGLWLVALTVLLVFLFMKTPPKSDGIQKGEFRKKIGQPAALPVEITNNKINEMINKINMLDKKLLNVKEQIRTFEKSIGEKMTQIDKTKDVELLIAKVDRLEKAAFLTDKTDELEILPTEEEQIVRPEKISAGEDTGEKAETKVPSEKSAEKKAIEKEPVETSISVKEPVETSVPAKESVETSVPPKETFERKVPAEKSDEIKAIAGELAEKKVTADKPDKKEVAPSSSDKKRTVVEKPVVAKKQSVTRKKKPKRRVAARKSFKKKAVAKGRGYYLLQRDAADREAMAAEYWLKRNIPAYSTYYTADQTLSDREAMAAEYWLKRNIPAYTLSKR